MGIFFFMAALVAATSSRRGGYRKAGGARSSPRMLVISASATLPWAISWSKRRTQLVYRPEVSISRAGS